MEREPAVIRLAKALKEADAPRWMIDKAIDGQYDDYKSDSATPCIDLVTDLAMVGLIDLQVRAMEGEFDAGPKESEAWVNSPEGQEAIAQLIKPTPPPSKDKKA